MLFSGAGSHSRSREPQPEPVKIGPAPQHCFNFLKVLRKINVFFYLQCVQLEFGSGSEKTITVLHPDPKYFHGNPHKPFLF